MIMLHNYTTSLRLVMRNTFSLHLTRKFSRENIVPVKEVDPVKEELKERQRKRRDSLTSVIQSKMKTQSGTEKSKAYSNFRDTTSIRTLVPETFPDVQPPHKFTPKFLSALATIGPKGPRMRERLEIPWRVKDPSVYQSLLHCYRLAYAKDYFILKRKQDALKENWRERPLIDISLPKSAADWKHFCLREYKRACHNHPKWSPGEKDDILRQVKGFLLDDALWKDQPIELNYDLIDDKDPFKIKHLERTKAAAAAALETTKDNVKVEVEEIMNNREKKRMEKQAKIEKRKGK